MSVHFRTLVSTTVLAIAAFCSATAQDAADPALKQAAAPTRPYGIITTIAGDGRPGYFGNNAPAVQAQLYGPAGIATDSHGNLYIADYGNNMIRMVSASSGEISTIAGSVEAGYSGDHGLAKDALLSCPNGIALDSKGNVFFSDACNNVVRRIDAKTGIITTVAGYPYMTGYDPWCQFGGDGGLATTAELCRPAGLAVDSADDLYIADQGNGIVRKVGASSRMITTVAGNPYSSNQVVKDGVSATSISLGLLAGVAIDSKGDFYIADSCHVLKVEASTGLIQTVAGLTSPDEPAYPFCGPVGDNVLATLSQLEDPNGIALDSAGNLFIDDAGNRLILRVDAHTGIIRIVAGDISPTSSASLQETPYTGIEGYTGDGGAATVARLVYPYAIAVDHSENIYIADTGSEVIRKVTGTLSATTPAPVIAPDGGAYGLGFGGSIEVSMSDPATGTKIYFTTDGTTPTTDSKVYTGTITLDRTASVIAFASSHTAANSVASQGNYFKLPAPTISPDGGSFAKPQDVMINALPFANVFYTTDGSDPCTHNGSEFFSLLYDQPLKVSSPLTIKAVATLGAGCGPAASANFIVPSPPVVAVSPATNLTGTSATLNGTINPGTFATTYQFAYSSSCTLPLQNKTAEISLPAGAKTRSVSTNVSGLAPGVQYCFQLTATNRDGSSFASGGFETQ